VFFFKSIHNYTGIQTSSFRTIKAYVRRIINYDNSFQYNIGAPIVLKLFILHHSL